MTQKVTSRFGACPKVTFDTPPKNTLCAESALLGGHFLGHFWGPFFDLFGQNRQNRDLGHFGPFWGVYKSTHYSPKVVKKCHFGGRDQKRVKK